MVDYLNYFTRKYLEKENIPLVRNKKSFSNHYLDPTVYEGSICSWKRDDTGGKICDYYIKIK